MNGKNLKMMVWALVAFILFSVFRAPNNNTNEPTGLAYSEFLEKVEAHQIANVVINENVQPRELTVETVDGKHLKVIALDDLGLIGDLVRNNVQFSVLPPPNPPSLIVTILISFGPMLLLVGVWVYFMRKQMGGGAGGLGSFGKSKARMQDESTAPVTFADVAGCDEAKEEVKEVVDFLKDPSKFSVLGGRIPRGLLLVGPPGTGKTLLAKSIAGEAKVPFFAISGSDFVEMYVGVGAARVRDMFNNAKTHAPCIIFIDEIDAVGRKRGAGLGGGNDEREQTLNQILVEMDGFATSPGVIMVAATNRPDILDAALLRPGRFDRQVYVTLPDIRGREQILLVHMRNVPIGKSVSASVIARGTPGMSGADLANLVNEAALQAARRNGKMVEMSDFEKAKDKILMGPERKSMVMPEVERKNTAYHEAGHALVGKLMSKCDPVHKVTIIPRGRALGVTMSLPAQDRYGYDSEYMRAQISMLFGGRIAEELFMGQMTTGASNDFERATGLARDMVMKYGMDKEMGPMVYAENEGELFLGNSVTQTKNMSEGTMLRVDQAIRRIIDEQYDIAQKLITENADKMHAMAKALLEWETIDADQIDDIMAGKPPRPPELSAEEAAPPDQHGELIQVNGVSPEQKELGAQIGIDLDAPEKDEKDR